MVRKAQKTVVTENVTQPVVNADEAAKQTETEPEFTGSVSLGTNTKLTTGRNKCGMAWKKESKRSQFSKGPPISYLKSMEEKARNKRMQERVQKLRDERRTTKQEMRQRVKEKQARKVINEFKSSTYQVVSSILTRLNNSAFLLNLKYIDQQLGEDKEVEQSCSQNFG